MGMDNLLSKVFGVKRVKKCLAKGKIHPKAEVPISISSQFIKKFKNSKVTAPNIYPEKRDFNIPSWIQTIST